LAAGYLQYGVGNPFDVGNTNDCCDIWVVCLRFNAITRHSTPDRPDVQHNKRITCTSAASIFHYTYEYGSEGK